MEELASIREKREGGGDDIDLLIRSCFIQDHYNERIKTIVKTKGSINTRMVQLVDVALEGKSTLRSERLKRSPPEKGQFRNQKNKYVHCVENERKEVRVATKGCHRAHTEGPLAKKCGKLPLSVGGSACDRHVRKEASWRLSKRR